MTLLSRDEEDILRENIEYHKSQGVDYFIATDNASKDATPSILKEYERKGILKYIREEDTYHQKKWVTRMARMAYAEFKADWVINNDSDEFWWPLSGNLKSTLNKIPRQYNVVRVKRHNFFPSSEKSDKPFYQTMIYRRKVSLNPIGKPLPSKVCHRGSANIVVEPGAHNVSGTEDLTMTNGDIEIYHYPIRNFAQTCNKVINIGRGYEKNPQLDKKTGEGPGVAQRTIYNEYKKDPPSLTRYYQSHLYNPEQIRSGLDSGEIVQDKKLAEYLTRLMSNSWFTRITGSFRTYR